MKIAVVLDTDLDQPDGVQQCVLMLNQWLSAQGHEVHYIVGETKRTDLANLHAVARNISVRFNGNRLTMPLPTSKQKLQRLLDDINPDVVHVHVPYSPFMGAKAIKAAPDTAGIVGTFHVLPYGFAARYGTKLLGIWLHSSLKRFNAIYAGTPAAATFASWSMGLSVGTLPHAVTIDHFKAARTNRTPGGKLKIVFLGRLVQRKGALQLVKAITALPKATLDQVEVRIGGKGEQHDEIEQIIADNQLQDCVSMDGFVAEDAKPAYLAAADIAIFPSISGESFGISLIVPMAAGAGIVLGGDNPGYRTILGDWPETLFDPLKTQEFASYLANIIDDVPLRNRIHALQQTAVEMYDVNTIGPKWLQIYDEAINSNAVKSKQ